MFVKKKYLMILLVFFLAYAGLEMYHQKTPAFQTEIKAADFVKISQDKKNILYQDNNGKWVVLLKISEVNRSIISSFIPWLHAEIFTQLLLTPDKNKLIVSVCNNTMPEDDHAERWYLLYDFHKGTLTDIPGNNVIGFSASHQLVFTSYINDAIPAETNVSVIDLATGEVILSHELSIN